MNSGSLCIFLGTWLLLSGFIKELCNPLNLTLSGAVAILISLYGVLILKRKQSLIIGFLGLWLFINGIVFENIMPFNFIFIGFIIAILGFSCICREDEDTKQIHLSLKDQIRNCFKFYRN
jgi:hypothetical protein